MLYIYFEIFAICLFYLIVQISKIDARIMRNVTGMQQLELKLEPVSAHDYQSILLPLVNSYLRVCIK